MINQKQKVNAITSYFFMAIFFMIPSKNLDVRNKFVLSHTKSALFLQAALIISYIIFIHLWYFSDFFVLKQNLNHIMMIAASIFILFLMWIWILKANAWEDFSVFNNVNLKTANNLLWKNNENYWEKEKLFTVLSYIPFIWILINKDNREEPIFSIAKFSSLVWIFFAVLFMWNAANAISLSILFYIIFVIFVWLFLFIKNEILFFNLNLPTLDSIYLTFVTALVYIRNLIFSKEFVEFKKLRESLWAFFKVMDESNKQELEKKNKCEVNSKIFYIPVINIFWLIFLKTRAKNHIISWLIITIILIWLYILNLTNYGLFLVFFIAYWMANSDKVEYKLPFIYDIYSVIKNSIINIRHLFWKAKEKSKTKETSMKVWEDK